MITSITILLWSKTFKNEDKVTGLLTIIFGISVFMAMATDFSIISFLN